MIYNVTIEFTEPVLGTVPMNKEIYTDFVASKAYDNGVDNGEVASEIDTVLEGEKGKTGFHRQDDTPVMYNYVLKGFFKDACSMLRHDKNSRSSKLTAFKKKIDGMVFVSPRRIPITDFGSVEELQRPLRAQTAQGERVALAASEMISEGARMTFTINTLGDVVDEKLLREWLDYGALRGLGQWRNGGYGSFTYEIK